MKTSPMWFSLWLLAALHARPDTTVSALMRVAPEGVTRSRLQLALDDMVLTGLATVNAGSYRSRTTAVYRLNPHVNQLGAVVWALLYKD